MPTIPPTTTIIPTIPPTTTRIPTMPPTTTRIPTTPVNTKEIFDKIILDNDGILWTRDLNEEKETLNHQKNEMKQFIDELQRENQELNNRTFQLELKLKSVSHSSFQEKTTVIQDDNNSEYQSDYEIDEEIDEELRALEQEELVIEMEHKEKSKSKSKTKSKKSKKSKSKK
jgi:hypothetical protein